METAVLDACVLFRGGVRDFLLWVAEARAFSPVWLDAIHEEWMRSRWSLNAPPICCEPIKPRSERKRAELGGHVAVRAAGTHRPLATGSDRRSVITLAVIGAAASEAR